jgi:hypothetical protein
VKKNELLDAPIIEKKKSSFLLELILWWEKKRLYYNIILIGVIANAYYEMWFVVERVGLPFLLENSLFHLVGANLFYILGWGPSALVHLANKYDDANNLGRWVLFILGTAFSILWMDTITYTMRFSNIT